MTTMALIWNTYGPYHIARVRGLQEIFPAAKIWCLSHCLTSEEYTFFNKQPPNHVIIVNRRNEELQFFHSLWRAYDALRILKPAVILACGYERAETLAGLIYARLHRSKIILMLDNQADDSTRYWVKEFVKSVYLKWFDGFLYGGNTHEDYLRHLHVPMSKEKHGYNCVDNARLSLLADEFRARGIRPVAAPYFLCVARLIEKKNIVKLIAAFGEWRSTQTPTPDWKLVIIGDGPERTSIESRIRQLNVTDSVELVGEIANIEEICKYYAFAKCFVLASHHNEQWGLVVNEAMACGLPVLVSSKCGCAGSLVQPGKNGYLLNPESTGEMAERLNDIYLANDRLAEFGEQSRRIIADYTPLQFALNVKSLIENK